MRVLERADLVSKIRLPLVVAFLSLGFAALNHPLSSPISLFDDGTEYVSVPPHLLTLCIGFDIFALVVKGVDDACCDSFHKVINVFSGVDFTVHGVQGPIDICGEGKQV